MTDKELAVLRVWQRVYAANPGPRLPITELHQTIERVQKIAPSSDTPK